MRPGVRDLNRVATLMAVGAITAVVAVLSAGPAPAAPTQAPTRADAAVAATCAIPNGLVTDFVGGGQDRTFLIQAPVGAGPGTPMVISLHGATGNAAGQQAVSGFDESQPGSPPEQAPLQAGGSAPVEVSAMLNLGAREGFIAVFPQARADWGYIWDAAPGSADVRFVGDLTRHLQSRGCSSPAKTSINGLSMGAMMASRAICARPELYSGAAMVGGVLNPTAGCQLPSDREVLVVHGLRDTVVPFDGTLPPILADLAGPGSQSDIDRVGITSRWANLKRCPSPGFTTPGPNIVTDFSCAQSTTLAVVGVTMGHVWDNPGLNTSRLIWAALRPPLPCVYQPPRPPDPAMAAALTRAVATDIAFRVDFQNRLKAWLPCNPALQTTLAQAIRAAIIADPDGPVAQQMAFALRQAALNRTT